MTTQTLNDAIAALEADGLEVERDGATARVYEPETRRKRHLDIEGGYHDKARGIASYVVVQTGKTASGRFASRVREILAGDLEARRELYRARNG